MASISAGKGVDHLSTIKLGLRIAELKKHFLNFRNWWILDVIPSGVSNWINELLLCMSVRERGTLLVSLASPCDCALPDCYGFTKLLTLQLAVKSLS